jgi:hypothetical protein
MSVSSRAQATKAGVARNQHGLHKPVTLGFNLRKLDKKVL